MVLPMSRPVKHSNTGVYYLRKRVPTDLVAIVGRAEIWKSLRTKDPAVAKERYAEEIRLLGLRWKAMRTKPEPLPHPQIVALSGKLYRRVMQINEAEPGEPEIWEALLQLSARIEGRPDAMEQWYGPSADAILLEEGLAADDHSRTRLIQEAHRAAQQAAQQQLKRAQGDYRPDPDADRFPPLTKPEKDEKPDTVGILDLFELWKRDHLADGKSRRTPRDHWQKIDDFINFVGHDDAARVTPQSVVEWSEHLRHERNLSAKTVNDKYLSALRAVFSAGVSKFRIAQSPLAGVRVRVPKPVRERPKGFTDDEAEKILACALNAENDTGRTAPLNKAACRWVPWVCAYTGARGGEIAQLRGVDFIEEYGIPCVRITSEDDGATVKTGQYRTVPLHPHLVEQGLLDFVKSRGDGPLFYVPNNRKRKPGTTQAMSVRGKVGEWVRDKAGITDKRLQPNHAWRHRFKTVARDVDIDPRYMDAIQGHDDGSASADYGENTMKALYREIQKLPRYGKHG